MTDEPIDIAVLKQLVLVGRYITRSSVKISIFAYFLRPQKVQYLAYLTTHFRLIKRLCGFGSDGDSATPAKNGN